MLLTFALSKRLLCDGAVTVCQAPPMGFLEDQMERGWWAGSDAGPSLPYCPWLKLTVPYCTLLSLTEAYCTSLYLTVPYCFVSQSTGHSLSFCMSLLGQPIDWWINLLINIPETMWFVFELRVFLFLAEDCSAVLSANSPSRCVKATFQSIHRDICHFVCFWLACLSPLGCLKHARTLPFYQWSRVKRHCWLLAIKSLHKKRLRKTTTCMHQSAWGCKPDRQILQPKYCESVLLCRILDDSAGKHSRHQTADLYCIVDLKHLHNVELHSYCHQAFLSLDVQCRDDISELKQTFWEQKEHGCAAKIQGLIDLVDLIEMRKTDWL